MIFIFIFCKTVSLAEVFDKAACSDENDKYFSNRSIVTLFGWLLKQAKTATKQFVRECPRTKKIRKETQIYKLQI
jgi:hypothetical protein